METLPNAKPLGQVPAKPFLKWVGGKRELLPQLKPLLPHAFPERRYFEPFAGGAALFFDSANRVAHLSDINPNLIVTYRAVRDDLDGLVAHLQHLAEEHSEAAYYAVRDRYNRGAFSCGAELAAAFIYLNKTGFNGLHRVNRRGHFNVPFGRYVRPTILDPVALHAAHQRLAGATLKAACFDQALDEVREGDFVYLDPPYVPSSATASFCAYERAGFSERDQVRLREVFEHLSQRGALLMLTNSDTPTVRRLYSRWNLARIQARRAVNCRTDRRGTVHELVVRNYQEDSL